MSFDPTDPKDPGAEEREGHRTGRKESLESMLGFEDFFQKEEPESDPFAGEDPFAEPLGTPERPAVSPDDEILADDLLRVPPKKRNEDSFPWELPEFHSEVHGDEDEDEDGIAEISEISSISHVSTEISSEISAEISAVSEISEISAVSEVSEISTEVSNEISGLIRNDPLSSDFDDGPTGVGNVPAEAIDEATPVAMVPVEQSLATPAPEALPEPPLSADPLEDGDAPFSMDIDDVPDIDLYAASPRKATPEPQVPAGADEDGSDADGADGESIGEAEVLELEGDVVEMVEEENFWVTPPGGFLSNAEGDRAAPPPLPPGRRPPPPPRPAPSTPAAPAPAATEPPAFAPTVVEIADPGAAYAEPDPALLTTFGQTILGRPPEERVTLWEMHADGTEDKAAKSRFLHEAGWLHEAQGNLGAAIKDYARAMDLNPHLAPNLWHVRRVLFLKGLLEKVRPLLLVELQKCGPAERYPLHYWSGLLAEALQQVDAAQEAYQAALLEHAGHLPSRLALWRLATISGDTPAMLEHCVRMAELVQDAEFRVALHMYAAQLHERLGDAAAAVRLYEDAVSLADEHAPVIWQALARLCAGNVEALTDVLDRNGAWLRLANEADEAAALHLEASVLRERDGLDPEGAFAHLDGQGLDHPLVASRLLDLAWRNGNWDHLSRQHEARRNFETALAQVRAGNPLEFDAARDPLDVLWLCDAVTPDPRLNRRLPAPWSEPAAAPDLHLLCAYREGDPAALETCLSSGAAPAEAWWAAYWMSLEQGPEAAAAVLERMGAQDPALLTGFFVNERIRLCLLGGARATEALEALEAQEDELSNHLLAAELALAADAQGRAAAHFEATLNHLGDPEARNLMALQAARGHMAEGRLDDARRLLDDLGGDPLLAPVSRWLARLARDQEALLSSLEADDRPEARLEAAWLRARTDAAEGARVLETVDGPEARWLRFELLRRAEDPVALRELAPVLAADYLEDASTLLAAIAIELRDRHDEDASDLMRAALTACPGDRVLFAAAEREFARIGRPRELWHETSDDLTEAEELEKWISLAWDEEDAGSVANLEDLAGRAAEPVGTIARRFLLFVALRDRDDPRVLELVERDGDSTRVDFLRFWATTAGDDATVASRFARLERPFFYPPEELFEVVGDLRDAPGLAHLPALAAEGRGLLDQALRLRPENGPRVGACLALSRIARVITDVGLLAEAESHLALLLPAGHPRRLLALERTAAGASLCDLHELALQAAWLHYEDTPGVDALRQCVDYAIGADHQECLRFFLIQAQYQIPDDERMQLAVTHLGESGEELVATDPSEAALPALLGAEGILAPPPLRPAPLEEPVASEVPSEYWLEDAELLLELALSNPDPDLIAEAAALFLMAKEPAAAQGALDELAEDHAARALFQLALAVGARDANQAFPAACRLADRAAGPLHAAIAQWSLMLSEPIPEATARALPEAWSIQLDDILRNADWERLVAHSETCPDDAVLRFCVARALQEHDAQKSTELYLSLLQGEMSVPALLQILRLAWRIEGSMYVKPALMRLSQLSVEPLVALERLRAGMEVTELPAHALVVTTAYLRGLVPPAALAGLVTDPGLRARLLTQAALEAGEDVPAELAELAPDSLEPRLVRRLNSHNLDPEALTEAEKAGPVDGAALAWWLGVTPAEVPDPLPGFYRLEAIRLRAAWDDGTDHLPAELRPAYETLARLQFLERGGDVATDRLVAFARHDEDRLAALEAESLSAPGEGEVPFGLLLLSPDAQPKDEATWILACHRREGAGLGVTAAWEPALAAGTAGPLTAWRVAICEELTAESPSEAWTLKAPPEVTDRVRRRWERRAGIPLSPPAADATDETGLGCNFLHSLLTGAESIEYLRGETDPLLCALARRSMFRLGLWQELTRHFLDLLDTELTPPRKAECFRQMIRIDSEGRADEDSAVLTRRALGEMYPQDTHNLLCLLELDRGRLDLDSELVWFGHLARGRQSIPDRVAASLEAWRLEYLTHRTLPTRETVLELVAQDTSDPCLTWWAFCLLADAFPYELATRLYPPEDESGMVFSRRALAQRPWEDAREDFERLMAHWPSELALLDQLLEAALSQGAGELTHRVLAAMAEDPLLDAEARVERLYVAALALETWAELPQEAVAAYARVLELRPDHEEAFLRNRSLLVRQERHADLAALLMTRSLVETRPGILARLLVDLADLELNVLLDRKAARSTHVRVADLLPTWKPGLSTLSTLHEEVEDWPAAVDILARWLAVETDPFVRCSICRRLGNAERIQDHPRPALDWYIQSLELDQAQLDLWEKVVDLHLGLGDPKKAAWGLKKCLTLQPNIDLKVTYLQRLGDIYETQIHDNRLAREAFVEAVDCSDGSLVAVESLVHFYERHADGASRNVKLDLLWTAERQKVTGLDSRDAVTRLAHFATWKRNQVAGELLGECARALGAADRDLPVPPKLHPMNVEVLRSEEVGSYLFPQDLLPSQRRMIKVVHEEACRQLKDVFKKSVPGRSDRVKQPPEPLQAVLGRLQKAAEVYTTAAGGLTWLPMDPPVLLIPSKWPLAELTEPMWQFLLGGHLFLHEAGLSIPLALSADQLVHLLAAVVQNVFPERRFEGMDQGLTQDYARYAQKIVGRKDRDLLAGTILEMGTFDRKDLSAIQEALLRTADRAGYLCAGGFAIARDCRDLLEDGPERLRRLLQFLVTQTHFQLREAALVEGMRG